MILKNADDKSAQIAELERRLRASTGREQEAIRQELNTFRAGVEGERDAAYHLDFYWRTYKNSILIHDLRLKIGSRTAQIDHLIINRLLEVYVLESKNFKYGLQVNSRGEFHGLDSEGKLFSIESPLAQAERHVAVLKDAFDKIEMPSRAGIKLKPSTYYPYVLVAPKSNLKVAKGFEGSSRVVKADLFVKSMDANYDKPSVGKVATDLLKLVSPETLCGIGKSLIRLHRPKKAKTNDITPPRSNGHHVSSNVRCGYCGGQEGWMGHKYSFFFHCDACDCNSNVPEVCAQGHAAQIRQDGQSFYLACFDCKTDGVLFVNPDKAYLGGRSG
jgi:hypothetical protein